MAIISINDLSKRYHRALPDHSKLDTLGETLVGAVKRPFRFLRKATKKRSGDDFFWALRDINVRVEPGEVVGFIGANGAGKSTLLKVLSRITEPTTGRIVLRGRLASLLEVGTGFHPQLTGRENVFLNGAILGMKRQEIRAKFDEIVAFSEIEDFLDTPVRHYSSGMYVRLAFAVAAHLNPEILVVDEVLAVGDFAFQRKCLGKMTEVSRNGRTILFVSHSMPAVEKLCSRGIVLSQGRVVYDGDTPGAIRHHLHEQGADGDKTAAGADLAAIPRKDPYRPVITGLDILNEDGTLVEGEGVRMGAPVALRMSLRPDDSGLIVAWIGIENLAGEQVVLTHTNFSPDALRVDANENYVLTCRIPSLTLCPGEYRLTMSVRQGGAEVDHLGKAVTLMVASSDFYGTGRTPQSGMVVMPQDWTLKQAPAIENERQSRDCSSLSL